MAVVKDEIDLEEFYELWNFEWNEHELLDEVFDWLEVVLEEESKTESNFDKKLRLEGLALVMNKVDNIEFLTEIWRQLNTKGFLSHKSMLRFLNEACNLD